MKTKFSVYAATVAVANIATIAFAAAVDNDNSDYNIGNNNNKNLRRGLNNEFSNGNGGGNNNGNGGGDKVTLITVLSKDTTGGVTNKCNNLSNKNNGKTKHVISTVMNACIIEVPAAATNSIENDPDVEYVELDMEVHALVTNNNPVWGLDRIDQCSATLDGNPFTQVDASGVKVYILDTGVRSTHTEFAGMIGTNCDANYSSDSTDAWNDGNGHGTHVAGTVVGKTYGVAECTGPTGTGGNGCELCAVKVLSSSGSGTYGGVIAGIDFVAANCGNMEGGPFDMKCVANMSLGGGESETVNTAVNNAVNDFGVVMAVAAGNDNADACGYSPASAADAITVGSTDNGDARSSFSN